MGKRHAKVKVVSEREYHDKLNDIRRDANGKITHRQGKPVNKFSDELINEGVEVIKAICKGEY